MNIVDYKWERDIRVCVFGRLHDFVFILVTTIPGTINDLRKNVEFVVI